MRSVDARNTIVNRLVERPAGSSVVTHPGALWKCLFHVFWLG